MPPSKGPEWDVIIQCLSGRIGPGLQGGKVQCKLCLPKVPLASETTVCTPFLPCSLAVLSSKQIQQQGWHLWPGYPCAECNDHGPLCVVGAVWQRLLPGPTAHCWNDLHFVSRSILGVGSFGYMHSNSRNRLATKYATDI